MAKLAAILALGICSSLFPAFKYVSSVLRETDRFKAELGGARILQGLSVLSHAAFERGLSGVYSAADTNFKGTLASARDSVFSGAAEIARTSSYMRQASSEKHANISAIYTAESLDAFPDSRSKASTLLEMSDGALVAGGLYSDPATDRYLLMKICGSYFPKIYSGLFRLQAESGVDGDKSQLSAIHDELLDDIDDLSSALRALSVNFEIGDMIKSSSEKIFRSGKELADSMFSYDEFNPDEISKRMVSFETLCVQMWVYCSGLLADMLAGALAGARDSLVYFCAEYALFLIFLSSAALAVAFGIRRSARRTATLARACLSGSPEEARVRYYSAAPFFGREFGEIDALILEAAAARSRLLELSKKLSVACISGRNEIEAASASNSKMLDFADSSLAELEKSLSDSELYGGALKAAGRISGAVSELAASLPKKDDIAGGFARIISEQSEAVRVSGDSIDSALESVGSIGRLAGEIASIADRASLLSLNISIEVGKSGGSGSGLSVLAEQIKTLAKRTGVVVLDMEDVGVNCAESLNAAKSKIAALAAPLSAGRRDADRVIESVSAMENSISSLSYAAERMEGFAQSREGDGISARISEARKAIAKAEKSLMELSKISRVSEPALEELSREISSSE